MFPEGVEIVLSGSINNASVGAASSPSEFENCLGSLVEATPLAPEITNPQPDPHDRAAIKGLGCIRGLRYALLAEVLAGFLVYGIWRLIHTWF